MIYIDDETNVPIRLEAYDWLNDTEGCDEPFEEYTYTKVRFNQNLSEFDFDSSNPEYGF